MGAIKIHQTYYQNFKVYNLTHSSKELPELRDGVVEVHDPSEYSAAAAASVFGALSLGGAGTEGGRVGAACTKLPSRSCWCRRRCLRL